MTTNPSTWHLIALALMALLSISIVRRHRRRGVGLHITALALGSMTLGYGGVFQPDWFTMPAREVVERTGWPAALHSLDIEIVELREMPRETLSEFFALFGWLEEPTVEEPPALTPGSGRIEATLVPYLVALVAVGLRALTVVSANLAFLIALVWSAVAGRGSRTRRLALRVEALERGGGVGLARVAPGQGPAS